MKPFFSIIIPVYNVAPYLRECLDSVLHQTFENWEAICVDDGSTDESGAILDEYGAKDNRFKVIHQQNGGVSSARNRGLEQATGEWILFLDSDDVLNMEATAVLCGILQGRTDLQLAAFKLVRFGDSGGQLNWNTAASGAVREIDISKNISELELFHSFSAKSYRRELLSGIKFKSYKRGEDLLFLSECLNRVCSVILIDKILYGYRQHQSSVTKLALNSLAIEEAFRCHQDIFSIYANMNKLISRRRISQLFSSLICKYPLLIFTVPVNTQHKLWKAWYNVLISLRDIQFKKLFPPLQRLFINFNSSVTIPPFALASAIPFGESFRHRVLLLWNCIRCIKKSIRLQINKVVLFVGSKGCLPIANIGSVYLIGRPDIEICKGGMVKIGRECILRSVNKGYHVNLFAPVKIKVSKPQAQISVGDYTRIYGSLLHAFKSIEIGSNVLIAGNCQIFDSNGHQPSWQNLEERGDSKDEGRPIVIEDYVWIGTGSIILPGSRIGRGSIIGAGSVVSGEIPPMSVAVGNPARVKKRLFER